jgi:hypothetical protein
VTEWIRVKHPITDGSAIVPVDSLPLMTATGWEPVGEATADRMDLLRRADQEVMDADDLDAVRAEEAAHTAVAGRAADVLDAVGDDPDAARAALEAERGKEKPRTTLVTQLQRIADAGPPANQEEV